ncbi:MAG: DNA polymerase I [Candidatus Saganbacteria bacterium]|nr:DNA polymerase I [Candidatus Saganbacteria bacterium]
MDKRIILIDGNSLAYRAFYALPDTMKTSTGIPTNALYGFTSMLTKILDEKPAYIAIAFDLKAPTFRHKAYKEYKATRQKAPPTLIEQMPWIKEIAGAFDIPIFEIEGYEADDVIGTLAKEAEREGLKAIIFTGDLDALQLVTNKVSVQRTRKGISDIETFGPKEVETLLGVKPEQVPDFKSLKGDSSDNIPGVPGIGDKTATALIQEFGSLENLLKNSTKISKEKIKEKVEQNKELAILSKHLATIVTNVPIQINFEKMKRKEPDSNKIVPLLEKLEFKSLVKKYRTEDFAAEETAKKKETLKKSDLEFICVNTTEGLGSLIKELEKCDAFAFDTETSSINPFEAVLIGISIAYRPNQGYYIPLKHKEGMQISEKEVLEKLKPFFESEKIKKYGHHLKYDIEVLSKYRVIVNNLAFDTMIAEYLIEPEGSGLGLKYLASKYLSRTMLSFDEIFDPKEKNRNFADIDIKTATTYAGSDAAATFDLVNILKPKLEENNLIKLFNEVEMPLVQVLAGMETIGIYIDAEKLEILGKEVKKRLKHLENQIYILCGQECNLNSPKQLSEILFNKLKLPIIKRTKTGISTDASVLEELAPQFEVAAKLLEYRNLTKLLGTYIESLPELISPKTGRIHTSFNQTITATGRLSSSKPNLQNIPIRGEIAKEIREAFVPEKKGWVILSADYSQIELRVLAHLSKDEAFVHAFENDLDIHKATASEVNNVPLDQVTDEMRSAAKAVNFGIIYGMGEFGLAKQLGITRQKAKEYIDLYFLKHKGVQKFIHETIQAARENGYVTTMLGRKRPMLDINSPNMNQRQFAERTAINTPVQGSAADMIKVAMININNKCQMTNIKCQMILQVHDELVFELPKEELETIKKIVEEEMRKALPLDVPVKVSIGIGASWGEAKT